MRRKLPVFLGTAFLALVVACQGPAGPQGPAGDTGATGPQGPAGVSPVVNCQECHNDSTKILARVMQYEHSVHYTGGNFARASDATCAVCHSDEGFVEKLALGTDTIPAGITNPTPPSCRTCHMIHTNYDSTDLRLRTTDPVVLLVNGDTVDLGKNHEANLCINCHQPRKASPMPTIGGDSVTIASAYYDLHHGTQGAVLAGTGAFEFTGSQTITGGPTPHGGSNGGCPVCHMAAPYGDQAGGHTMNMTYTEHGSVVDNTAGCLSSNCHSSMPNFDHGGVQTTVAADLDSLQTLLTSKGILDASGSLVLGTYPANLVAAYLNWSMFTNDGSMGVHNPPYVQAVLQNTIEKVKAMP